MNPITLLQPPRIAFGNGCAAQCAELLKQRRVRRVLLVSSKGVLPRIASWEAELTENGLTVIRSPCVHAEPTIGMFEAVLKVARWENVEAVVGVGGGSVMDVAKLAAALAKAQEDVRDVFGINLLAGRELFLVCLPTTSGTGSEVSPNAVLLDEDEQLKKGVISPHLIPDAALIDPLLTLSVSPAVTAATGLDALTHCIEAYANRFAHPVVDFYALEGIRLIAPNLLRAVQNGCDVDSRAKLSLGSFYGGLCLGPVNTAAVHALAYPLGGQFHVAHGVANAVLLPHVIRFNISHAPERYAMVASALGADGEQSVMTHAEHGVELLFQLSKQCGIPQRLSELGVPREAIPGMAKSAMQVTRLLKNNVRQVMETDVVDIYEAAF